MKDSTLYEKSTFHLPFSFALAQQKAKNKQKQTRREVLIIVWKQCNKKIRKEFHKNKFLMWESDASTVDFRLPDSSEFLSSFLPGLLQKVHRKRFASKPRKQKRVWGTMSNTLTDSTGFRVVFKLINKLRKLLRSRNDCRSCYDTTILNAWKTCYLKAPKSC